LVVNKIVVSLYHKLNAMRKRLSELLENVSNYKVCQTCFQINQKCRDRCVICNEAFMPKCDVTLTTNKLSSFIRECGNIIVAV
jgi:hypothetical protein